MVMMKLFVITIVVAKVVICFPVPEASDLALIFNENNFDDYMDFLSQKENHNYGNISQSDSRKGCTIKVNGDLGQPQPVYIHKNNYLTPTGTTGQIHLLTGEEVTLACTGSRRTILHPNISTSVSTATATCVRNVLVSGEGWLNGKGAFGNFTCSSHSTQEAVTTSERCFNNNLVIRVGYSVNNVFYPLYWSCFDQNKLEVLYVWYELNPTNAVHQTDVDRPSWLAGSFFSGVDVNSKYSKAQQKNFIAILVGADLAEKYVTNNQYLARGHLAAKTDFIYATGQRATFYFINCAPQWQSFNAGNWKLLEQNLRKRIGQAGYNTVVYTGTFGVAKLRNADNQLVDIYLHRDENNNPQLPVPLYYYKVVYDASRHLGTAFIGINNPYYSLNEARALQFCPDKCRNNTQFDWIGWQPDRVDYGYGFCCTINDFRRFVPHLPVFTVKGLLS